MRERVKNFIEENAISFSYVARSIGYSSSALSQYLNGSYKGDVRKIEERLESFIKRFKEKKNVKIKKAGYIDTKVSRQVFEVCRFCQIYGEIGVVYGEAGIGKTEALREYVRRNPDTIFVEADLGYTTKVLIREIHKATGGDGYGGIHEMFVDIVHRLKNSGRLIIVDEAEHLPRRALDLLRRIYDKAEVGIVLVGLPVLIENIRGRKRDFAQLYSRVGIACRLEGNSADDTRKLVESYIPNGNGIYKVFHREAKGNMRSLVKLITQTIRVSQINDMEINESLVRETSKLLLI